MAVTCDQPRLRITGPTFRQLRDSGPFVDFAERPSLRPVAPTTDFRTIFGVSCSCSWVGTCDTMRTTVNGGIRSRVICTTSPSAQAKKSLRSILSMWRRARFAGAGM